MSRPASGSVTRDADRYRARVTLAGRRINLGTHATEDLAWEAVEAALQQAVAGHVAVGGEPTLRSIGTAWLDQRDLGGIVDSKGERRRWKGRVLAYPVADIPLRVLTQADVEAWLARVAAATSRETAERCLALVRGCLRSAVGKHLRDNPAKGARLPGRRVKRITWALLEPEEQASLVTCEAIPEADRIVIAAALGTGIRQGEHAALQWPDLDLARQQLTIRRSRKRDATKGGKERVLPLFGLGLAAFERWVDLHPGSMRGLIFPAVEGGMRSSGHILGQYRETPSSKPRSWWPVRLRQAGITRRVRWHDLRHTFASALISGWHGRRWSLEEVAAYLGDTMAAAAIYAHLGETALKAAVRGTKSIGRSDGARSIENAAICLVGQEGLEPSTDGLKVPGAVVRIRKVDPSAGQNQAETLAARLLVAMARRDPSAERLSVELAEAVLSAPTSARRTG